MIGFVGIQKLNLGLKDELSTGPISSSLEGDFIHKYELAPLKSVLKSKDSK
jgi:hypothetical protein